MTASPHQPETCRNCSAAVTGTYCPECGQRWLRDTDPTLAGLLGELFQEVTNVDGKIFRTFRILLLSPGQLTVDFFAGRRARYVTPLRLYFLTSLLLFVGVPLFQRMTGASTTWNINFSVSGDTSAARRRAQAQVLAGRGETQTAGDLRTAVERWVDDHRDELQARFRDKSFGADAVERLPRVIFAFLPLFATLLWLVYRGRPMRYPRHLYVAVHLHAAFFLLMTIRALMDLVPSATLGRVALAAVAGYMIWYAAASLKRVYGGSWISTLARLSVVSIFHSAALTIGFLASIVAAALAS